MRIIFVRHGEPDYEHDCLTGEGRKQALAAAERLRREEIEEIWSSPLGRAAETAGATSAALGLPVRTLDFMRELSWGSVDGTPVYAGGHPWEAADEMVRQGWNLADPSWRSHPFFANNRVTAGADDVARKTDEWLAQLGYVREGAYYRCCRPDSRQKTVALFCHGGSSSAAIAHMINMTFPCACALFHQEFTGITILRLDRNPGARLLPCLELVNDAAHIGDARYHRLREL